ncbi:MAG: inositol 2-dehydrogenase [Pseudomonadota bacterium]
MKRIGLLGAGRIGKVHAAAISAHRDSMLVAVADVVEAAANALADDYGIEARSADAILEDKNIDAVLIATSTDTHSDLIEAAVDAGKAVLCEKPVDLDLDRARACLAHVKKSGQPVMVGFNRRFDPNFAALKSALEAGEIGQAELLTLTSFDPGPPPLDYIKVSGGMFRDMMIHDFDMAQFLMGAAPVSISAHGSCLVDDAIGSAGDIDTAVATLQFEDGCIAVIKNSRRAAYGYDQRIELLGAKGLLEAENVLENTVVKSTSDGVTHAKPEHFFLERYMRAYQIEWDAFVTALDTGVTMPATLEDGVTALAMAEAATLSAQSGRPVRLAEI